MNNDDECHIRSALQKTAHCSLLRNYMPPATLLYNGTADLQTQDPRQGRSNHDSFCDLFICVRLLTTSAQRIIMRPVGHALQNILQLLKRTIAVAGI